MIALMKDQRLVALTEDELDLIRADLVETMRNPIKNDDPKLVDFFNKREELREKIVTEIEHILLGRTVIF